MKSRAGFTLIELLVVMTIIAVLMSIAGPRYFASLARSKDVDLQENLKIIRITLDKFNSDKGRYPQSLEELVEAKYLRNVPLDPVTESTRTWVVVPVAEPDKPGVADVRSGAPGIASEGRPYATY